MLELLLHNLNIITSTSTTTSTSTSRLLATCAVLAVVWFLWSRRHYYRVAWQMPGPWGWPFIGMAWHMLNPETFLSYMNMKSKSYAAPFISWMGANCFLYVNDPETVEAIFNSPHCKNKGTFYRFMADAIGDGLFTSSGARWTKHRRLINPAFSRQVISNFLPIFNAESNEVLAKFELAAAAAEPLEIYGVLKKSVLEMACQTTMGRKMNFQQNRSGAIFKAYSCLTDVIVRRMLTPWLYADFIYRRTAFHARQQRVVGVLFAFIENLLQSGVSKSTAIKTTTTTTPDTTTTTPSAEYLQSDNAHDSIASAGENKSTAGTLPSLPSEQKETTNGGVAADEGDDDDEDGEDGELRRRRASKFIFVEQVRKCVEQGQLTWQDVRDEANVIIAATFETTSTALYFVCLCLAMHAECQDKLYAELLDVFPAAEDTRRVSAAQLERLRYTEAVINEAMRLFAPVPIVLRSASQDFVLPPRRDGGGCGADIVIPCGTQIGIDIFNMQRSTEIWGEHAQAYRPELHFGAGAEQQRHAFAFVPFTRGLRMCIGYRYALMLMKLMVAKIFRHYRLRTDAQLGDLRVKGTISLKLHDYPLCEVLPRPVHTT